MPEKPVLKSLFDFDIDGDDEPQTGVVAASEAKSDDRLPVEKEQPDVETEESNIEESKNDMEAEIMTNDMGKTNNGAQTIDALDNFEETFDRLKAIVEALEREDIKLGEMVRLFEEGVGLIKKCDTYLKDARERVGRYIERGDDGKWIIKGLDGE